MKVSEPVWRFCGKLALSMIALAMILRQVDASAILSRAQTIRPAIVPAIIASIVIQLFLWGLRWRYILQRLGATEPRLGTLLDFLGASSFYGQLLPSSIGADMWRTALIVPRVGLRRAILSVVIDRLWGLLILAAWVALTLPLIATRFDADWLLVTAAAAIALLAAIGALLFARAPFRGIRLLKRFWPSQYWNASADLIGFARGSSLGVLVTSSALMHLTSVLLFYAIARSISVPLDLSSCMLLFPVTLLASALPISLGGWGVREGAAIGAFSLTAVSPVDILTTSMLFGLTVPATGLVTILLRLARQRTTATIKVQ